MIKCKVKVLLILKMVAFMKENFPIMFSVEEENSQYPTMVDMRVVFITELKTAKANIIMIMVTFTKDFGKITQKMVPENTTTKMVLSLKGII